MRPAGISAFVRCRNEEEYIVASLMSVYRIFDEIVVILNNSTDRTRELVQELMTDHQKIRLLNYDHECAPVGPGYLKSVGEAPDSSLAKYYNWCMEHTTFSHVCKWDGDMIAIAPLERAGEAISSSDVVLFDGYDVLGEYTTDMEARIFRYDLMRARYVDWDLYEILEHDYHKLTRIEEKCFVHLKLVKKDWLHKQWLSPNLLAARSVPHTGGKAPNPKGIAAIGRRFRQVLRSLLKRAASKDS